LKNKAGDQLDETIAALQAKEQLSLSALAAACREGPAALTREFGIPPSQSERLAAMGPELPMLIEELDPPDLTEIELNVGPDNAPPEWRSAEQTFWVSA
jgi:hypothetical protein